MVHSSNMKHDTDPPVFYEYSNRKTWSLEKILSVYYCVLFIADLVMAALITIDLAHQYQSLDLLIPIFLAFFAGINGGIMVQYIIKTLSNHGESKK